MCKLEYSNSEYQTTIRPSIRSRITAEYGAISNNKAITKRCHVICRSLNPCHTSSGEPLIQTSQTQSHLPIHTAAGIKKLHVQTISSRIIIFAPDVIRLHLGAVAGMEKRASLVCTLQFSRAFSQTRSCASFSRIFLLPGKISGPNLIHCRIQPSLPFLFRAF